MRKIIFKAFGHPNVIATHRSTFEITKDPYVTPRGDCIIAVKSELGCKDLPNDVKELLRKEDSKVVITLRAGDIEERVYAYGHPKLILASENSIVIRRSTYIDERTLAIKADKAARDLSRTLITLLKNPGTELEVSITVF